MTEIQPDFAAIAFLNQAGEANSFCDNRLRSMARVWGFF